MVSFAFKTDLNNGKFGMESESNNQLVALREQPVKEVHVEKRAAEAPTSVPSGSGK